MEPPWTKRTIDESYGAGVGFNGAVWVIFANGSTYLDISQRDTATHPQGQSVTNTNDDPTEAEGKNSAYGVGFGCTGALAAATPYVGANAGLLDVRALLC